MQKVTSTIMVAAVVAVAVSGTMLMITSRSEEQSLVAKTMASCNKNSDCEGKTPVCCIKKSFDDRGRPRTERFCSTFEQCEGDVYCGISRERPFTCPADLQCCVTVVGERPYCDKECLEERTCYTTTECIDRGEGGDDPVCCDKSGASAPQCMPRNLCDGSDNGCYNNLDCPQGQMCCQYADAANPKKKHKSCVTKAACNLLKKQPTNVGGY